MSEKQAKKFENLKAVAEKLKRYECDTFSCDIRVEKRTSESQNGIIYVEMDSPVMLDELNLRSAFAELLFLSDDVVIAAIDSANGRSKIRYSFGVMNIY